MRHVRGPGWRLTIAVLAGALAAAGAATAFAAAKAPAVGGAEAGPSGFLTVDDPIAGSYLVVLKGQPVRGVDAQSRERVGDEARGLAGKHGGTVGSVYSAALRGFALTATKTQARALAADPSVQFVQQNGRASSASNW